MNENRENILQRLYAIRKELRTVLHYEEELQALSRQLRAERKTFQSSTMRAKFNQVLDSICVATAGVCAVDGLLKFRFDEMVVCALLTVLIYKFFTPMLHQDKKLNILRIGVSLLCIWLVWFFVDNIWKVVSNASLLGILFYIIDGVAFVILSIIVYHLLSKKRLAEHNTEVFMRKLVTRPE